MVRMIGRVGQLAETALGYRACIIPLFAQTGEDFTPNLLHLGRGEDRLADDLPEQSDDKVQIVPQAASADVNRMLRSIHAERGADAISQLTDLLKGVAAGPALHHPRCEMRQALLARWIIDRAGLDRCPNYDCGRLWTGVTDDGYPVAQTGALNGQGWHACGPPGRCLIEPVAARGLERARWGLGRADGHGGLKPANRAISGGKIGLGDALDVLGGHRGDAVDEGLKEGVTADHLQVSQPVGLVGHTLRGVGELGTHLLDRFLDLFRPYAFPSNPVDFIEDSTFHLFEA